ncbi:MAG: trypsin-like peptidase domain-containing protein [Pseudonocardiaceae bacterium]
MRDGIAVGTAFVVSADGVAATAEHVIGSRRDASWAFEPLAAPGLSLPVDTALPADPAADVALVRIAGPGDWQPMALASHTNVPPGDPVHLRGFAKSLDYDFTVSLGRSSANRIYLNDGRDSRFHGKLSLVGLSLVYQHVGSHPAFLVSAARQVKIGTGASCPIGDKDRLRFASGVILVEFSAPDLYDPNAGPTATAGEEGAEGGNQPDSAGQLVAKRWSGWSSQVHCSVSVTVTPSRV